jgi:hypothetical protein
LRNKSFTEPSSFFFGSLALSGRDRKHQFVINGMRRPALLKVKRRKLK